MLHVNREVRRYQDTLNVLGQPTVEPGDDSTTARPVAMIEVKRALAKSKGKSSPGEDKLSYKILKHLPEVCLDRLARYYTLCLNWGYFPIAWKKALVTMIPKPSKDLTPNNYRPISLLPCLGKLFEKIIKTRVTTF